MDDSTRANLLEIDNNIFWKEKGQSRLRLTQIQDYIFKLSDYDGYKLEFILNDSSGSTELLLFNGEVELRAVRVDK